MKTKVKKTPDRIHPSSKTPLSPTYIIRKQSELITRALSATRELWEKARIRGCLQSGRNRGSTRTIRHALLSLDLALAALVCANPAHAITQGSPSSLPWVVRVLGATNENANLCSGAAINDVLVVTAKHCVASVVQYSDDVAVAVASKHPIDGSDIQILVLNHDHNVGSYPTLGPDYISSETSIPKGSLGKAYGYGGTLDGPQKGMSVKVELHFKKKGGDTPETLRMSGRSGMAEGGDSGGPLMINNLLVGVLKGGGQDTETGQWLIDFHGLSAARSVIRTLEHAREMRAVSEKTSVTPWIADVSLANKSLSITLNPETATNKAVVVSVNDSIVSTKYQGACYNCSWTKVGDRTKIVLATPVNNGDLIQISAAPTSYTTELAAAVLNAMFNPGNSSLPLKQRQAQAAASVLKDQEQLYENRFGEMGGVSTGINSIRRRGQYLGITIAKSLSNSEKRIVVWYNGVYVAEIYKGYFYGSYTPATTGDSQEFTPQMDFKANMRLQIGVVPGTLRGPVGTPDSAKLLYDRTLDL